MFKKLFVSLGFFLLITGCQDKGLDLHITFDQVEGLTAGNRLIFDQNNIGRVDIELMFTRNPYCAKCLQYTSFYWCQFIKSAPRENAGSTAFIQPDGPRTAPITRVLARVDPGPPGSAGLPALPQVS